MKTWAAAALLLLAVVPAQAAPRDDLLAADRRFSRLSQRSGAAYAFLATAANSVRLYGPGETPVFGRTQVFRTLGRPGRGVLAWEPLAAAVSGDGRMGWTDGRWTLTPRGRMLTAVNGHYVHVWTRQRNGAWKIQTSMRTIDPPKR